MAYQNRFPRDIFSSAPRERPNWILVGDLAPAPPLEIDVGGGSGFFLFEILKKYPQVSGTLYDLDCVISEVQNQFPKRCELKRGDFFESIPTGGDLYILKYILHDWDDDGAEKIISNCKKSMKADAKIILLEMTISEEEKNMMNLYLDLLMLTGFNGKERSVDQLELMLRSNGFQNVRFIDTRSFFKIIEARC